MVKVAKNSLLEQVKADIEIAFNSCIDSFKRVVWWDRGGHLQKVIKQVCDSSGIRFIEAEKNPLSLRKKTLENGSEYEVWYIPEAKNDRDWFRDIRELGDNTEIICSLEELAAIIYGVNAKEIIDFSIIDGSAKRQNLADILKEELTKRGRPNLNELKGKLVTQGRGNPVIYILRNGWELERKNNIKREVVQLITEMGIDLVNEGDRPEEIVEKLRRLAVAQWLLNSGLDNDGLPLDYREINNPNFPNLIPKLKRILQDEKSNLIDEYMKVRWKKAIEKVSNPWDLVDCPVEGSLEYELWTSWYDKWEKEEYVWCKKQAKKRYQVLKEIFGFSNEKVSAEMPAWFRSWYQASLLADVSQKLKEQAESYRENISLAKFYGHREEGVWLIDKAVRKAIVSGSPEEDLPSEHPARNFLAEIREKKLTKDYLKHLEKISKVTKQAFEDEKVLEEMKSAHRFWSKYKEELATGEMVVIFYIDALRYDLACDLADRLREITVDESKKTYDIKEEKWAAVFPTETKFGMGALTPGRDITYEIKLSGNKLKPQRNNQNLGTAKREDILEDEGWQVTRDLSKGWKKTKIAYFDSKFDDLGEKGTAEIEKEIDRRVDELAKLIKKRLEKADCSKAFVVTDHGFLLLPKGSSLESITPPSEAKDVKRRRCVSKKATNGVVLSDRSPEFSYLKAPVNLLINPLQRFRKQGVSDSRFSHGGALPQEFILNFLKIERS